MDDHCTNTLITRELFYHDKELYKDYLSSSKNLKTFLESCDQAELYDLLSNNILKVKLDDKNLSKVSEMATKSDILVGMGIKESINRSFEIGMSEGILFERRIFNALFSTDDKKEGMSAFIEKRTPKFEDK